MKRILVSASLAAILALPAFANAGSTVVAFDMVDSGSMNLLSYTNVWTDAFGSPGDGFQKYRRGVSPSIPFSVLDDSLFSFPSDTLGIIDDNNTHEFFGAVDTVNSDTDGLPSVSATWVFDIAGFSDLYMSIDAGAMGDFEDSDIFSWEYSIDGGSAMTAFSSSVDTAGALDYTLAGGAIVNLADPILMNGVMLNNQLATFLVPLVGDGDELTLTLTMTLNGGSEAVAFQNLVIEGTAAVVPVPAALWLFVTALGGLGFLRRK